jgi:hypothetical protein
MTLEELQARLTTIGLNLPETDLKPLSDMVAEIERAATTVRQNLQIADEMGVIFATDRLTGAAS